MRKLCFPGMDDVWLMPACQLLEWKMVGGFQTTLTLIMFLDFSPLTLILCTSEYNVHFQICSARFLRNLKSLRTDKS